MVFPYMLTVAQTQKSIWSDWQLVHVKQKLLVLFDVCCYSESIAYYYVYKQLLSVHSLCFGLIMLLSKRQPEHLFLSFLLF